VFVAADLDIDVFVGIFVEGGGGVRVSCQGMRGHLWVWGGRRMYTQPEVDGVGVFPQGYAGEGDGFGNVGEECFVLAS